MKKLISLIAIVGVLVLANDAMAKKTSDEPEVDLPVTIGVIVEMPDGSIEEITLPDSSSEVDMGVTTESLIIFPIVILPPINFWQLGWFSYGNVVFFGWRGPNGAAHVMTFWDGVWCLFRFEVANNTWYPVTV